MKGDQDEEEGNHAQVLRSFESCGYEVRYLLVDPTNCGVPMSRARIHYQGINVKKVPNAKELMDTLFTVWRDVVT